jgi:hypothetical protein
MTFRLGLFLPLQVLDSLPLTLAMPEIYSVVGNLNLPHLKHFAWQLDHATPCESFKYSDT